MKAALLRAIGAQLEIAEVPTPRPAPDEALVRTVTCGLCRTDLHLQEGLAYVPQLPHIPGHEPAGVVVEVGSQVTGLPIGSRVAPYLFVAARECFFTRSGEQAQATHLRGIIGVTLPGGFAEYFTAPARNLLTLPDAVPFDLGGLTSCAVITAVHACRKAALQCGERALVIGAGGIGSIMTQLLRHSGVRVAVLEAPGADLARAHQDGAELAVAGDGPESAARLRSFVDPDRGGFDAVFETVGRAATMAAAADLARRGGQIVVVGEEAETPPIDTVRIAQRELRITGSRNGSLQDARDALGLMACGAIRPPIRERFALGDINTAFARARRGGVQGRIVIEVAGEAGAAPSPSGIRTRTTTSGGTP
jgi:propanol-preferring alcohol dehydrogenase